jgi:uncharacterized protein (UPF0305 family)
MARLKRAARYVTNRYRNTSSVTSMLGDLEWDTLEIRRKKIRLTMMYKIINNLIDIRAEEYLTKPTRQTRSSHSLKYQQFSASTDYYKHSFFPQTTSIWNTLPAEAPCLVSFKQEKIERRKKSVYRKVRGIGERFVKLHVHIFSNSPLWLP